MPPLVIILITSTRTEYALRTITGIRHNLQYSDLILWYVAADHTNEDHLNAVLDHIGLTGGTLLGYHAISGGYGASVNRAWEFVREFAPVTLWLEDDWQLRHPLDVTPYAKLLCDREDVGCIRLGHMPIDLDLESKGYDGRMYLDVKKTRHYAFSGNPHLKHTRFMDYGLYPIGQNPGNTEVAYDHQVRSKDGAAIWWPLLIGDSPPFGHIGEHQSYDAREWKP